MPDYYPKDYQGYSISIKPVGFWRNLLPWETPYYVGDTITLEFTFRKNPDKKGGTRLSNFILWESYPDGNSHMNQFSKMTGINDDNYTCEITTRMMPNFGQFSFYIDSTRHLFNTEIIHRDVRRHEILFMVLGALLALLFMGVIWLLSIALRFKS